MATVVLLVIWCGAGLAGLHFSSVEPARGASAWADSLFAALLGPFSFLIAGLAAHMTLDDETERDAEPRRVIPRRRPLP